MRSEETAVSSLLFWRCCGVPNSLVLAPARRRLQRLADQQEGKGGPNGVQRMLQPSKTARRISHQRTTHSAAAAAEVNTCYEQLKEMQVKGFKEYQEEKEAMMAAFSLNEASLQVTAMAHQAATRLAPPVCAN